MKKLLNILLIDDDSNTNFINKYIFDELKVAENITIFENAKDALHFLKDFNNVIDLILLDINMPGMTGWDFMEEFENSTFKNKTQVVILFTTSRNANDIKKVQNYPSIKKYVNKPLTYDLVNEILLLFK